MLQNSILKKYLFALLFVGINTFAVSNLSQINVIPRGNNVNLVSGSRITNTPYGYYLHSFTKQQIETVKHTNLSQYANKKVLIGYGIYDINNKYCRYLSDPNNRTFDQDFADRMVYGGKTYGISRRKMTFTQCRALTARYSGYVYTPKSASAMYYIFNAWNKLGYNNLWLGYHRVSCQEPYLNDQGYQPTYDNLYPKNQICNTNELDTYVNTSSSNDAWLRTDGNQQFYCPIMINSSDYLRPVKVCLPWWRIQRTWQMPNSSPMLVTFNGHTYNFAYVKYLINYPLTRDVCTEYNTAATQAYVNGSSYQTSCLSYDSMLQSPSCMDNINQPVCHVDQCKGYIENSCIPEPSKDVPLAGVKNYQYGYVYISGVRTRVKVKQNIKVHMYKCTPPPPPLSKCKVFEKVQVFPATCPGSNQCSQLASCLKSDITPASTCLSEYKCIKSYGSVDNPVLQNGQLIGFYGICPNGDKVVAPIKRLYSSTSKCLAYNYIRETNTTVKTCTSQSTSQDYTVSTAITSPDIYQSNPRCIRTNNIAQARPNVNLVFKVENQGFMNTLIQKVYIDGHSDDNTSAPATQYLNTSATSTLKAYGDTGTNPSTTLQQPTYSSPVALWTNAFLMHSQTVQKTVKITIPAYSDLEVESSNHNSCDDDNVNSIVSVNNKQIFDAHCKSVPGPPLYTGWVQVYNNFSNPNPVTVTLHASTQHVVVTDPQGSSSESTVEYRIGKGSKPSPSHPKSKVVPAVTTVLKNNASFVGSVNGYSNIYAIENYTNGKFGYISNYEFKPPQDNIVMLNNKEAAPIVGQTIIPYKLQYKYNEQMNDQSTKNEKPTMFQGHYSGVTAFNAQISSLPAALLYVATPINFILMFEGKYTWGWFNGDYTIYNILKPPYEKYVQNPYGYDPRQLVKKNGQFTGELLWQSQNYASGTMGEGDYLQAVANWQNIKYADFLNMGFEKSVVDDLMTSSFKNNPYKNWSGFKWYELSGKKTNSKVDSGNPTITKPINTIYMGATNQVSIIVPYQGNYVVAAYDASGAKLGQITIEKQNFIQNTPVTNSVTGQSQIAQAYAKVQFAIAPDFNVVGGLTKTLQGVSLSDPNPTNACLASNFVEWGGGVSGAYYEQGVPDLPVGENGCAKSNDSYVRLHSATTITVRATNQAKGFTIHLPKPLPFANRVFLVTLNKLATRKYRCYTPLKACSVSDSNTTIPSNVPTVKTYVQ